MARNAKPSQSGRRAVLRAFPAAGELRRGAHEREQRIVSAARRRLEQTARVAAGQRRSQSDGSLRGGVGAIAIQRRVRRGTALLNQPRAIAQSGTTVLAVCTEAPEGAVAVRLGANDRPDRENDANDANNANNENETKGAAADAYAEAGSA